MKEADQVLSKHKAGSRPAVKAIVGRRLCKDSFFLKSGKDRRDVNSIVPKISVQTHETIVLSQEDRAL